MKNDPKSWIQAIVSAPPAVPAVLLSGLSRVLPSQPIVDLRTECLRMAITSYIADDRRKADAIIEAAGKYYDFIASVPESAGIPRSSGRTAATKPRKRRVR